MGGYSTPDEVREFLGKLGPNPMFVCDMDGNIMMGYNLREGRKLELKPSDNPQKQSIPFGSAPSLIEAWVSEGTLSRGIFANKPMDARLPVHLVSFLNECIENKENFRLTFLTSRGAEDAIKLLQESGVVHPEKATLVADSGATLYLDGKKNEVRKLSAEESAWLSDAIDNKSGAFLEAIKSIVQEAGFNAAECPDILIEHKGIATNIHYREILNHYEQPEGSPLDVKIGEFLKSQLSEPVANGPQETSGQPVFKLLDGPATVEVKIANVNKGQGLAAIAENAMNSGNPPSAVAFSGDDISKGNGLPGTDYFAMARADELQAQLGVPFFNILTHHPKGDNFYGEEPDPNKSPDKLETPYMAPRIDLTLPTPKETSGLILRANGIKPAFWRTAPVPVSQPVVS